MSRDDEPADLNELALSELGEDDEDARDDAPLRPRRRERKPRVANPRPAAPTQARIHTPTAAQAGHETGENLTPQARALMRRRQGSSIRTTMGVVSMTALIAVAVFGIRALGTPDAQALPEGHPDVAQMSESGTGGTGGAAGATDGMAPSPVDPEAVARLEAVLAENPGDVGTMRSLADLHYAVNDYRAAAQWHERILEVDPTNNDALMMLGLAAFNMGEIDTALDAWGRAIEANPENVEAHFNIGFAHLAAGDYAEAEGSWATVERLAPGSDLAGEARASIERLRELAGDSEGA